MILISGSFAYKFASSFNDIKFGSIFIIEFEWREICGHILYPNFGVIYRLLFCFQFCAVNFLRHIFALNVCVKCNLCSSKLMSPCFLHDQVRCPCIPFDRNLTGCTSEQGN